MPCVFFIVFVMFQTPRGLPPQSQSRASHRPSTADDMQPRIDSRSGSRTGSGGGGGGGVGIGGGGVMHSGAVVGSGGYSALESARRVAALPSSAAPASFLQV